MSPSTCLPRAVVSALAAVAVLSLGACAGGPSTSREYAEAAVAAMGGAERLAAIQTLSMTGGTGTRQRLGQTQRAGDPENVAQLSEVTEIADFAGDRASLHYTIDNAGFMQNRHEVLTTLDGSPVGLEMVAGRPPAAMSVSGLFSWGTQNSPTFLLRRNAVSIALAAAESGADAPVEEREMDGRMLAYGTATTADGEALGLYFDPETSLIAMYTVTDTETMLGDVPAEYHLADYRDVNGVMLPFSITIRKQGQPYSSVQFASMTLDDPAAEEAFAIPAEAAEEAAQAVAEGEYSRIALSEIGNGVWFAQAYSHNSLVVEFPTFVAVVEGAYTEAQSLTLGRRIAAQFPDKPIRYTAVTHHHYDHSGGVRGMAALGSTILAAQGHEPEMRPILEATHSNPPDELARRRAAGEATGALELFDGMYVIEEGDQRLELHAVAGSPHVEPLVIAFAPRAGVLFQSDIFFPGTGGGGPAAEHLLQSVRALKLDVRTNAGGHGGVGPFEELVKAVGG